MREKLANNMQVTLFTENAINSINSQISDQLLPNNILNANVKDEMHFFDQIKEEKSINNEKCDTYEEETFINNEEFETHEEKYVYNPNIRHVEDNKDGKTVTERNNCLMNDMCVQEIIFQGRCIIDISFVWSELYRAFNKHIQGTKCQFKDWKLVETVRHGLLTQFFFKCCMCKHEASIWSERVETPGTLDINKLAVAGTLKAGIGFSELNNLCSGMNIACMPEKTYRKIREKLLNNCNRTVVQDIKQESF